MLSYVSRTSVINTFENDFWKNGLGLLIFWTRGRLEARTRSWNLKNVRSTFVSLNA